MSIFVDILQFRVCCPANGVIVGIDYGSRNIGIAISDPEMRISFPYLVIDSKSEKNYIARIASICKDKKAIACVVGLPLNLDGGKSEQTLAVEKFAPKLYSVVKLPIFSYDERFSSRYADFMLRETGINRKQRNKTEDSVSAQVILDGFLTSINKII